MTARRTPVFFTTSGMFVSLENSKAAITSSGPRTSIYTPTVSKRKADAVSRTTQRTKWAGILPSSQVFGVAVAAASVGTAKSSRHCSPVSWHVSHCPQVYPLAVSVRFSAGAQYIQHRDPAEALTLVLV
jgi:hypothetical protein